jgi:gamma-glutamyl-gamma-aminobutyrate hydrolase PuuD
VANSTSQSTPAGRVAIGVHSWQNDRVTDDAPLIGLTSYAENARWAVWEGKAAVVGWVYVDAIHRAGGRCILIPPAMHGIERILDGIDGLCLAGGSDVEPTRYGEDRHPATERSQQERDEAELALVQGALGRNMPMLGICRGIQVMNVARGGTLIQHLPDTPAGENHREVVGVFSDHPVDIATGSRLEEILGRIAPVKSHHHQATDQVGEGLVPVAWAEDGTIEALEDPSKRFALGVQWHPEEGDDLALFSTLVEEARTFRAAQNGTG